MKLAQMLIDLEINAVHIFPGIVSGDLVHTWLLVADRDGAICPVPFYRRGKRQCIALRAGAFAKRKVDEPIRFEKKPLVRLREQIASVMLLGDPKACWAPHPLRNNFRFDFASNRES